jgi:PAS domain S-box-containing protein
MTGSYNSTLVVLSILVAMMASYIALDLAGRVTRSSGRAARLWLVGGAFAMGVGIWSMHFIGMLAFQLPVAMVYDLNITLVSMLFAIVISGLALELVSRRELGPGQLVVGGVFMGAGICAMHYTGMAAMRMSPAIKYDPWLFAASVGVAIAASMAALWLAFNLRATGSWRTMGLRAAAAAVMGSAIAGMHYTGMAAAQFAPGSMCLAGGPLALAGSTLAWSIGAAILCVFVVMLVATMIDLQLTRKTAALAQHLEQVNQELRSEVTARAHAEEALRASEERFRSAFENAPVGMAVLTMDFWPIKVSDSLCRMLGYSEAELVSRNRPSIMHPDDLPRREALLATLKSSGPGPIPERYELRFIHKDGRVIWTALSVTVVATRPGQPAHVVAHCEDISERKNMSEMLRVRSEELERSNSELEQFAYVASHDLQAPLRSVTGFVQLLQRRLGVHFDKDSHEYVQFITDSVRHMDQLIQALLQLGRVGKGGVRREPASLDELLGEARKRLESEIRERNAQIVAGPLPSVSVDRVLMIQVLQNLLGNAIKFTPQGAPQVSITARRGPGEWVVGVTDRGIGIERQHYERIFQIFQRLHTAEQYDGAGVGLTMCEKIVRLHGGRVWVDSRPGEGSTFYFSIPDGLTEHQDLHREAAATPPAGATLN